MPSDFMPRSKKNKSSSSSPSKNKSVSSSFSSSTPRNEEEEEMVLEEDEGYEVSSKSKKSRREDRTPQLQNIGDKIPPHLLAQMKQAQPTFVGTLDIDSIDSSRDLWIIDCPRNVDLGSLLEGKKIRLDGSPNLLSSPSIVKIEEGAAEIDNDELCYEATARLVTTEDSSFEGGGGREEGVMLLGPDGHSQFSIASAPLAGYITITQSVQGQDEECVPIKRTKKRKRHKLPSGIKIRHPQYGVLDPSESESFSKVTKTSKKRKKSKSRANTYY